MHRAAMTNRWQAAAVALGIVMVARAAEADWGEVYAAREIPVTADLRALCGPEVERAETLDFNGDGVEDYIVSAPADEEVPGRTYTTREYWITSEYQVVRTRQYFRTTIWDRWFVNLDADPEPEILTCAGYEDGVDCAFADQTKGLQKQEFLLQFVPIILADVKDDTPHTWGLPDTPDGLRIVRGPDAETLASSFDYDLEPWVELGAAHPRAPQRAIPMVFFTVPGEQGFTRFDIGTRTNLHLQEMVERSRRPRPESRATGAVAITGPTLIVIYPDVSAEELEANHDLIEVISDFEWHTGQATPDLERLGVTVHTRPENAVRIRVGDEVRQLTVAPQRPRFGYWLVALGREPEVLHGVYTDVDLIQEAREYFGRSGHR